MTTTSLSTSTPSHAVTAGALVNWGHTYTPTSPTAADAWEKHRELVEPLIAATDARDHTAARRIASAVLELLAWATPRQPEAAACLREEVLQEFLQANPTGLNPKSLPDMRSRVRRVLRAAAAVEKNAQTRLNASYMPRSEQAQGVWEVHQATLSPLIDAVQVPTRADRTRVASAVLDLASWGLPRVGNLGQVLNEDFLNRFLATNPTQVSRGALSNMRARIRKVLAVLPQADSNIHTHAPKARPRASAARKSVRPYPSHDWKQLLHIAATAPVVATCLTTPKQADSRAWEAAELVTSAAGVELRRKRITLTHAIATLNSSPRPLAFDLGLLDLPSQDLEQVSAHLPRQPRRVVSRLLRGASAPVQTPATAGPSEDCQAETGEHPPRCLSPISHLPQVLGVPVELKGAPQMVTTTGEPNPTPRSKPRPKRSARQSRTEAASIRAQAGTRAASFPEHMRIYIRSKYQPQAPVDAVWPQVKEAVEQTLAASAVRGEDSMRKHVTHLGHFFTWAHQQALPLTSATLTRPNLERYERQALLNLNEPTRRQRRSRLASMADQLHPDFAPFKGLPLERKSIAAPYTPEEMAIICRVARIQATPVLAQQVSLLVGLGAGAGIDSTDFKRLTRGDVVDHGDGGIEIAVHRVRNQASNTAQIHRTVWVLREYEDLVRNGLPDCVPNAPLIGRSVDRANVAASVYARATFGADVPHLTQGRLRSTWMATLLQRPVPLNVLLNAAGLTTARTVVDLLPHLPDVSCTSRYLR